ncbi:MAG: hypothetical protein WBA77_11050 [Microcoleaceae cyanobacterium]
MKITQYSATTLNLEVQKYFKALLPKILIASGTIYAGLMISIGFSNVTKLNCNRLESGQVDCEITKKNWLLQQTSHSIIARDIQSAEVDINDESDSAESYNLILITPNNRISLSDVYTSGTGFDHYQQSQSLNSFITASTPDSFIIQHDLRFNTLFGIPFIIGGICLIIYLLKSQTITDCIFDKELNKILITKRNILKSETVELTLSQLKEVKVTEHFQSIPALTLVMLDNENIYLKPILSNRRKRRANYKQYNELAFSINQFLQRDSKQ